MAEVIAQQITLALSSCAACFEWLVAISAVFRSNAQHSRLTSGQEVDEENAPSVPEYRVHHFQHRQKFASISSCREIHCDPMH